MASQAPPPEDPDVCLASMFTSVVSSLDLPARQVLADTVQYCHTRLQGSDTRDMPIMFFSEPDSFRQALARPHLPAISESAPPHTQPATPLNRCEGLREDCLYHRLAEGEKQEYVRTRYQTSRVECMQLGYRYLLHLAHPELPLECTIRPTPVAADMEPDDQRFSDDDFDDDVYSDEESCYTDISDVTYESEERPTEQQVYHPQCHTS